MDEKEIKFSREMGLIKKKFSVITVNSPESFKTAGDAIIELDAYEERVLEYWDGTKEKPGSVKKAHSLWKELVSKRDDMLEEPRALRLRLKLANDQYVFAQQQAAKAEQDRLDRERQEREDEARKKLDRAADRAEAKGNQERAEELRDQAAAVYEPPVVVAPVVDKTTRTDKGTTTAVSDIRVEVEDTKKILQLVIAGTLPDDIVNINETKLKNTIKTMKWKTLDGCRITEISNTQYRRKQ